MLSRFIVAIPIAVMVIGGSTACASKKIVNTSVGDVNDKVDALGESGEETQDRTRKNEGRITEVDQKAQNAAMAAAKANGTAVEARSVANTAGERANAAGDKLDKMDKANRRLVFEVVLSEDEGNFKFAQTKLPDEA